MIERGHTHRFAPVAVRDVGDGRRVLHSRCVSSPVPNWTDGCTLEREEYVRDGRVVQVRFRFQGIWLQPLDLLRLASELGVAECPDCGGVQPLGPCARCGVTGLVGEDGAELRMPDVFSTQA